MNNLPPQAQFPLLRPNNNEVEVKQTERRAKKTRRNRQSFFCKNLGNPPEFQRMKGEMKKQTTKSQKLG